MTRAEAREQRWIGRGLALIAALLVALVALITWSVLQTSRDRAAAAARAERTASELEVLAQRLDQQAAALDRQATALEVQADSLQTSANRADRSRSQFRAAAREILEQLGSDLEAFEPREPSSAPAPTPPATPPPDPPQQQPEPSHEPTTTAEPTDPEPTDLATTEPGPGCEKSGGRPPRCGDDDG